MRIKNILRLILILIISIFISSCQNESVESSFESTTSTTTSNISTTTTYDFSDVVFESKRFLYDGQTHSLVVENISNEYEIIYYNNDKKDVGEYEVIAYILKDNVLIKTLSASLVIYYNELNITFDQITYTYDGTIHYPKINGDLPDGVSVIYDYSNLSIHPGTYVVNALFINGASYGLSELSTNVVVNKLYVDINSFEFNDTFYYDGENHLLSLNDTLVPNLTINYERVIR